MADLLQLSIPQLHPAEVTQRPPLIIVAVARHKGGVQIGGAGPIHAVAEAITLPAFKAVVHVAEHHQWQWALSPDLIDGQSEVLITPIAGGRLPIAAAGIGCGAAEATGAAVGQKDQRQSGIGIEGGGADPGRRILQAHWPEHSLSSLALMKPAAGTGGPCPHHRQPGGMQLPQAPATVAGPEGIDLTLQSAAAGIAARVVIAEDAGHRQRQGRQARGDAQLTIAEITHHQEGIGRQQIQQLLIAAVPLPVQITGDGDAKLCQPDA